VPGFTNRSCAQRAARGRRQPKLDNDTRPSSNAVIDRVGGKQKFAAGAQ
jgi:hypothetical protein